MESFKFNKNDPPPHEINGGHFMEGRYSFNQVSKNQSQVPFQYSNLQFNSMPGQNDVSSSNNFSSVPPPPNFSKAPIATNNGLSGSSFSHPSVVSNMPFQNPSYHLQSYTPASIPPMPASVPLHTSVNSTQSSHRPLFNIPPPSVMSSGNIDPMKFGQFNFPPPPAPAPYFSLPSPLPNNNSLQYFNNNSVQNIPPNDPNLVVPQSSCYKPSTMFQLISNMQSIGTVPGNKLVVSEKENVLNGFLKKFNLKEKHEVKSNISVAGFHSGLQKCFSLLNLLQSSRGKLVSLLDSSQEKWEEELNHVKISQDMLSEACFLLSNPNNLTTIQRKLKAIKKKRILKKKLRAKMLEHKTKKQEERERLHQEIDKWFDNLKEKNEKTKRELEMKKEADNILAEVRRKIHEAKKTIEKLKVFEKLRSARQANAVQKGLYVQLEHSAKFEANISHLRETMLAQLSNYEQEEKALQVMLETEQEDRREEEALWRKRKLMAFQQKKQKVILESLFGDSEEPAPDDPLFLFYQYQNSGNKNADNLVQIRHHWDIHLHEEGESIPLQWVVPVPPNSSSWEECCTS